MRLAFLILLVIFATHSSAQEMKVTFDKTKDMSGYKTFQFGETEVITPKEERILDEKVLREKVNEVIARELVDKKLQRIDSGADVVVSYIIGALDRSDIYTQGPLGGTPGQINPGPGSVVEDFKEATFVVDLNDRSNYLVWRINAVIRYSAAETMRQVEEAVEKGFKKFPNKPKVKKK